MDKRTRKELERLRRVTQAQKDVLGGIYDDMFGSGRRVKKEKSVFDELEEKEPTAAELLDRATGRNYGKDLKKETDDAVRKAQDALRQAQDLMDRTDSVTKELIRANNERAGKLPGAGEAGAKEGALPVQAAVSGPAPEKPKEEPPKEPEKDPQEELDSLIGLTKIKHDVKELTDFVKIQKMRKDAGLRAVPVSLHLVFTGNPGTGKTTVARIISRIYKQIGVLSKGQLVEVDRSGLVAGYVGQTALKTQEQINKAMGGVLFIDEAYALSQKDDAFGQEAIDTILKAMEDHRDDLVVIVAGYTKPMERFIESNPGLKSRFNKYIEFPDYTLDELMAIFDMNCKKYDYIADEDVRRQIRAIIVARKLAQLENYANARDVRNMFEDIITNQARRVAAMENPSQEDMMTISLEDLSEDIGDKTDSKAVEKAEAEAKLEELEEEPAPEQEPDAAQTEDLPSEEPAPEAEAGIEAETEPDEQN